MKKCVFCTQPKIQERIICKNSLVFAFPTNIPITPGHTLIAPVRCVATFDELTDEELLALFALRGKVATSLRHSFGAEGFNCAWNEGIAASQNVPHLHLHIVPRKKEDHGSLGYDPRKFLYRPGPREVSKVDKLREVSRRIRDTLTLLY